MYDHFAGEIVEVHPARVVLRAGGVGYELKVPTSTSASLRVGGQATLHTILHVVDGVPLLLGFAKQAERELARRLLGVQGVGPSMCLALLSTMSPHEIGRAVTGGDAAALKRVKGVGAKTAERLCLELREVVAKLGYLGAAGDAGSTDVEPVVLIPARQDAVAALLTLGFTEKEARKKVEAAAEAAPEASTEDLIRSVLRQS
jgi:Holliday junction DNA helicase RuvA